MMNRPRNAATTHPRNTATKAAPTLADIRTRAGACRLSVRDVSAVAGEYEARYGSRLHDDLAAAFTSLPEREQRNRWQNNAQHYAFVTAAYLAAGVR